MSLKQNIKSVLTEVETFLAETLKAVKLGSSIKDQRTRLLEKVRQLLGDIDPASAGSAGSLQDSNASNGSLKISGGGDSGGGSSSGSFTNVQAAGDKESGEGIAKFAARDLPNKLQAGLLDRKKATGFKSWDQMYCVVSNNYFFLYKKQGDTKQKEVFCLNGYEFREAPELEKDSSKKDMCFELVSPGDPTYQFRAGSQEGMAIWKEAITKGIQLIIQPEDVQGTATHVGPDVGSGGSFPPPPPSIEADFFDDPEDIYAECDNPDAAQEPFPNPPPPEPTVDEESEDIYDACASELPQPSEDKKKDDTAGQPPPPLPSGGLRRPPPPPPPSSDQAPPPPNTDQPAIPKTAPPPLPGRRGGSNEPPPLPTTRLPPSRPGGAVPAGRTPRLRKPFMDRDEDFENIFYGKWDCSAGDCGKELSFCRGDMIHVLSKDFDAESWWVGELAGKVGLVPKEYLAPAFVHMA